MKNKDFILIFLFNLLILALSSEEMIFNINYIGIPVSKLEIHDKNNVLKINAKSTTITNFLSEEINNTYEINYSEDYLPLIYKKQINQVKFRENSITTYKQNSATYYDSISKIEDFYQTEQDSREIFTALFYIRYLNLKEKQTINIDVNRNLWKVETKFVNYSTLNSPIGKKQCFLIKLSFKKVLYRNDYKSDILSNNLVSDINNLYFWITNDAQRLPLKAKYDMSPFSVIWLLTNYHN
ncbi:MAG: DUF3108 domain-containing protein [Candidatus Cloacimonadales bacterium]|nr:DUF3108 domain-containing protein [Candidatus Cloacimonadota bacterium]MDD2650299.1 DUF3108 domain-containing protein [Candidatus Cloacimonadota bacterium]MDX9976446.1 DUF3108 domain-containing protein [Candidatus Cloacimonadales bacterium]